MVQILNWKDGSAHAFKVTDKTSIRCDKGFPQGKKATNASALVPALTVEVEAISTPEGMAEAQTISFNPDPFAVTAAEEKLARDLCSYRPNRSIWSWLLPD